MTKEIKRMDNENWEESFIEIFDDENLEFHKRDIEECIWANPVDEDAGEDRRWSRSMQTVIEMKGRFFAINWEYGLTEMQESYYNEQPYEVKKVKKKITVTEWHSL